MTGPGALVLVATPIGNLGDLSPRAVETLERADIVAAEDTRRTRALLSAAGIRAGNRLRAVHAHNERSESRKIVDAVRAGKRVAYVSDAGTPGIADPGERLVRACLDAGLAVETVPGPSALLAALVLSGLPAGRFRFEGFLPRKGAVRSERIASIAESDTTVVLFESPHRVAATLVDLLDRCGPTREVAVARELSKVFEDVVRGRLGEVAAAAAAASGARGEHVIVVSPAPAALGEVDEGELTTAASHALAAGTSARDAAAAVARDLGVSHRRAYAAVLRVRDAERSRMARP
jgi:16S rRNA (cytidine1402-2'-O)-methyltransferase